MDKQEYADLLWRWYTQAAKWSNGKAEGGKAMHKKLYYHKTDHGAEYLTDRWTRNPDGSKEGTFRNARIIVRIDGDLRKNAEISIAEIS